jgi:molybdopterin/thiamine biosynthesis adenylyltransferase
VTTATSSASSADVIRVIAPEEEDRFARFRLISWWDQKKLAQARVLVVGAGALGNEIIKNLALLGVGNLFVADMDRIENSNLSRSILYRTSDNGSLKALVAAEAAKEIYPQLKSQHFTGNVVYDLGLGVFRWADVIIAGLDNREARLSINRACLKVNRPWIDGAIEQIHGCARVFTPAGPCYECTMTEQDWKLLAMRRSCNLLSREQMEIGGRTPTTPTVSAIIAGVQCQEAVKLLHGMETIAGKGWVFNGTVTDAYLIEYQRKDDCYSHDTLGQIISLDHGVENITARELLERAQQLLGEQAHLELARDVLEKLSCTACGRVEKIFASLGKVAASKAHCPHCNGVRDASTFFKINGSESFLDEPLARIGVPPFDIVIARGADGRSIGFELAGDAKHVLGGLLNDDGLEWS